MRRDWTGLGAHVSELFELRYGLDWTGLGRAEAIGLVSPINPSSAGYEGEESEGKSGDGTNGDTTAQHTEPDNA